MLKHYIALDPGNSTGWCMRTDTDTLIGGTIGEDHKDVWNLLETFGTKADAIVYETFKMYPGKAQKLIWNSFYPCEVIGVIKVWATLHNKPLIGLQPSVKGYALANSELQLWKTVEIIQSKRACTATEHTRDAVRLLRYAERNA